MARWANKKTSKKMLSVVSKEVIKTSESIARIREMRSNLNLRYSDKFTRQIRQTFRNKKRCSNTECTSAVLFVLVLEQFIRCFFGLIAGMAKPENFGNMQHGVALC